MIIEGLTIRAFGKFKDYELKFEEGLNILVGDNEAGKSTIHQFIEAMFFGFFKPYTKKKIYEDTYEKYIPWDHSGYGGTMTVHQNGQRIRIERQFYKGKDSLTIYDANSGEDITDSYDYDKVTKMANVAIKHLGFNKVTYKNTMSLTQMQQRTEEDMVREIKDNMSNLASTHQATISVDRVIEAVTAKENKIGSLRKPTSPYKKLDNRMKALEEELVEARSIHSSIASLKEEENDLLLKHGEAQAEEKEIRKRIAYINQLEDRLIVDKVEQQKEAASRVDERLNKVSMYKSFNVSVVNQLQKDKEVIQKMNLDIGKMDERRKNLQDNLEMLTKQDNELIDLEELKGSYEELKRSIQFYEDDEKACDIKHQEQQSIALQRSMLDEEPVPKRSVVIIVILALLGIASMVAGIIYTEIMFGFVFVLAIAYMFIHNYDKQKVVAYEQYLDKLDRLEQQINIAKRSSAEIKQRMENNLKQNDVADIFTLKLKRDELLKALSKAETKLEENKQSESKRLMVKQELDGLQKTIASLEARKNSLVEEYNNTLTQYDVSSSDAVQSALEKHHEYVSLLKEKESIDERINELLDGRSLQSLKKQLETMTVVEIPEGTTTQELDNDLDDINGRILVLREHLSEVMTRGNELSKSSRTVAEIEEELEEAKVRMRVYERELNVAAIIKDAVSTIAEDIQNNFAPVLNEALSDAVTTMSDGKYKDIKVNPQMALTIYDETSHRTVKADSLSEGTIDMLYFGLRLGVGDVLSEGRKLPLILDDAFVQYDDKRLSGALNLLQNQHRQVLLFTCHEREKNHLDTVGKPYHLVKI